MSSELGPEARSLIADADGVDSPSRGDKERVRSRLALRVGVAAAGVAAGATAKGAVAGATGAGAGAKLAGGAIAGGGGAAIAAKLIGAAVVISTVALGVSTLTRRDVETTRALPPEVPTSNVSTPPPAVAAPPAPASTAGGMQGSNEETRAPASASLADPAPPARGSPLIAPKRIEAVDTATVAAPANTPALVASQPPAPELDGEAVLLQRAQAASAAGDGVGALALLDAHQQRFPNGVLAEQRDAERVVALCAMGRVPAAREAAERFLTVRPRSAQADRVRRACRVP